MLAGALYEGVILRLLKENKSFNYLEIGSYDGEGISKLAKEFPDRKFYCIDPFIEDGYTAQWTGKEKGEDLSDIRSQFNSNIFGCDNIFHFNMTSKEFIEQELYDDISIDVLFIDGDHSLEGAALDLSLALLLARGKTIHVVMDDLQHGTVAQALNDFMQVYDIEVKEAEGHRTVYFSLNDEKKVCRTTI